MLDLWPYKVGLKERVGAIAKELQAPEAKLAIRAAIGAGRHTMISTRRCTGSSSSPATQGPSTWCSTAPPAIFCRRREPRRMHDADRAVVVLLPVPRAGNPSEADAATRRHVGQMLAVLVEVPSLRVAVLAPPGTRLREGFTATAFDSGACADHIKKWLDRTSDAFASENDRCTFIAANKLANARTDLYSFVEPFLVAHFDEPVDYVRRAQHSLPDRPAYHGLESPSRDRRAWTIELQRHASLPLPPDSTRILRIVLADRDLFTAIPSEYRRLASVAAPRSMEEVITEFCESKVA